MMASTASIAESAHVPVTARVWGYAQIREEAHIGERVIVGRGAYIGPGVVVGEDSKIQNLALLYEPAVIGRGVFIGPSVVLTNDRFPRAWTTKMTQKQADDWDLVGVSIFDGASIGAGAICVAPLTVGHWAMVAAGSLVTRSVPDYGLVAGNPARQIGWVGRAGQRLIADEASPQFLTCPATGEQFQQRGSVLYAVGTPASKES